MPRMKTAAAPVVATRASTLQAAPSETTSIRTLDRFEDIVALAVQKRDLTLKTALERDVRLVRMEDGRLEIALEGAASRAVVQDLSRKLSEWTGRRWMVIVSAEAGAPTLKAQADARQAELETGVRGDPLVQAVLKRFPGAQIIGVRGPAETVVNGDADLPIGDSIEDIENEQ
jgi:DNA polymerase-3 subunit gamma/tau